MTARILRMVPAIVALALLAGFLGVPYMLGRWVRAPDVPAANCDRVYTTNLLWASRLRSAWELEADGGLEQAENEYRAALGSDSNCIREAAKAELQRISEKRDEFGPAYRSIAQVADVSTRLRALFAAVLLVIAVCWGVARLLPRRGTRIGEFPVFGCNDERSSSRLFRDALVWFANDIKRVYSSEYARSQGMTLIFDDLKGQPLGPGRYDQARADAQDPEAKAAVRFALIQVIQFIRDAASRPRLLIEGDVRLFPGGAKAAGILTNRVTGRDTRIEARVDDLPQVPWSGFVQDRLLNRRVAHPQASPDDAAEELRQTSNQLYTLALLMACKIRFTQSQSFTEGYKPDRWESVCVFAAGALDLE